MRSSGGALSRLVRAVSVPLLFAEVSEIVVHVTDTVFLARVGTVEVGAIALADSLLEVAVVLTVGLIEGIQILFARRVGEGRHRAAGDVFNLGLLLLTGLYNYIWVSRPALAGQSEEVRHAYQGVMHLKILLSLALFVISFMLLAPVRAMQEKRRLWLGVNVALGLIILVLAAMLRRLQSGLQF